MLSSASDIGTIQAALDWTCGYLERFGDADPRYSAEWLIAHLMGISRTELYVNFDRRLSSEERAVLCDHVFRRAQGEPLQLISAWAPFRYLSVIVAPDVLIPRPETEVLVDAAIAELGLECRARNNADSRDGKDSVRAELGPITCIDLCSGSGCIACSLASEYPRVQVLALDIAPEAIALARRNVEVLGLEDRVEVRRSDLFSALCPDDAAGFDLIISNPPYVPSALIDTLSAEVRNYEPRLALDGGTDGLCVYRRFLVPALSFLKPGGLLAVELFEDSLQQAAALAEEAGFASVRIVCDLNDCPRVLLARKA